MTDKASGIDHSNDLLPETDDRVLCYRVNHVISGEMYRDFLPRAEEMVRRHGEIRILVVFEKYDGWEEEAALMDLSSSLFLGQYMKKIAMINVPEKMLQSIGLKRAAFGTEYKFFEPGEFQEALDWARE